jgi:RNA polymerase sigma factor (sigma-70 family)
MAVDVGDDSPTGLASRPRDRDDAQLVRRLRAGDDAAFDVLHHRYAKRLERYAARVLGGRRALAEDVVQEALIRAHRALRRDHAPVNLAAWLHRLVRNCCLDELSRTRFAPLADDSDVPERSFAPAPHAVLEQRDAVHGLLADLAALPSAQRHALLRRELDGLGHEELARELGVTPQASKQLVHRARLNVIKGREARDACCLAVQGDLLAAHDERRRASAATYRHLVTCRACRGLRERLRTARRGTLALVPPAGLALLLGALGVKLGSGGKAAAGGVAVFAASAAVAAPILVRPGDPSPVTVSSPAVPGGTLAAGAPLPPATAMVTRLITFARGDTLPERVTLTCPEGTKVAGLLPPIGASIGVGYGPGTTVGADGDAELVFERGTADTDGSIMVGTLCRAADERGSVIPGGDPDAAPWTQACADHTYLLADPGGEPVGSVRSQQPLRVDAIERGWAQVQTDTRERGWVEVAALCDTSTAERP